MEKIHSNDNNRPWFSSFIWYQIFPDRFRRSSNSSAEQLPKITDLSGSWPHDLTSPWAVSSWGSDWYKFAPHEVSDYNIHHHIQRRRFCGNLQGIIDKLDYLKTLGIEGIYITPLSYSPSSHKYDATCLHHIDPFFGPDPEGDKQIIKNEIFHDENTWRWTSADLLGLDLLEKASKLGIKVIFDGVFNHIGITSPSFQDVIAKQENSFYKEWFKIESFKNGENEFKYNGWYGVKELPQLLQTEDDLAPGPKKYIYDVTKRWLKPIVDSAERKGIDGWRLDVAFCINHGFWKKWREFVLSLNPSAFITGEIVDCFDNVAKYLKGDEFHSVMNYNFFQTNIDFFVLNRMKPSQFAKFWKEMFLKFPKDSWLLLQNLLDSHDTARILTIIRNRNIIKSSPYIFGNFFKETKASSNEFLICTKPEKDDYEIFKLMVAFQMTFPGSPLIFYGDEVGMWGANDPDCRKPMLWNDIHYENEKFTQNGKEIAAENIVEVNKEIFNFYCNIINAHKSEDALRTGLFSDWIIDDEKEIYGLWRETEKEKIGALFNNSINEQSIEWSEIGLFKEILSGKTIKKNANEENITLNLSRKSFCIFKKINKE